LSKFEARAEVSGSVHKIIARVGDGMEAGKPVIYIESMKLEIPVLSDDAGTVREVQAVAILVD